MGEASFKKLVRINGILTYIESSYCFYNDLFPGHGYINSSTDNFLLFVYNHGFPDYSIKYKSECVNAGEESSCLQGKGAVGQYNIQELEIKDNSVDLTRFPSKMRDLCLYDIGKHVSNVYKTIFITFNTNGICGSTCGTFYNKTLVKDMNDIETIVHFFCDLVYNNRSRLVMIGLSTGAFLTFSYATNFTTRGDDRKGTCKNRDQSSFQMDCFKCESCRSNYFISHDNLVALVCIACVDDIPSSYNLDFDPDQIQEFRSKGHCEINSTVPFVGGNKLSVDYLNSYKCFPSYKHLSANKDKAINVPTLLIHGTDDKNVPFSMSLNLLKLNRDGLSNTDAESAFADFHGNKNKDDVQRHIFNFNKEELGSLIKDISVNCRNSEIVNKEINLYVLDEGNHLVTNARHMKRVQNAISLFVLKVLNNK